MAYMLIFEISRKQDYIFKSNKIAEIIGASFIVKKITEELPEKYYVKYGGREVFSGGGKSLYIFDDKYSANQFTREFSKLVIEKYPGIELFITGEEFEYDSDDVIDIIDRVYKKLAVKKSERKTSVGISGFGISRLCHSTKLPACECYEEEGRKIYISKEIYVKRNLSDDAHDYFKNIEVEGFRFSKEIDELGKTKNEKSYIAVVHIDGNRMGKRIKAYKEKNKKMPHESMREHNENYIKGLNRLSNSIKDAYIYSFKSLNQTIAERIDKIRKELDLKENVLPIRPLILAGDDVCFVCDARIGIECAKIFIEKLNSYPFYGETLHACAGIAIVKNHYPFAKAYELAEQLCQNAKNELDGDDTSLIDWHIAQGEIYGSINYIRDKHYYGDRDKSLKLNMRPIYIDSKKSWRNYHNFVKAYKDVSDDKVPRNKIKELRQKIREGKEIAKIFIQTNGLENVIHRFSDVQGEYGFTDENVSMYYDAIEAMDFYFDF